MHIPAKVDYGIRALLALAAAGTPQTAEYLAGEQGLPRAATDWPVSPTPSPWRT
jgi:DNA-binding IscR family transcriptional regulator